MVRTATLMLLATYNDTMCPSICVEAIEKLGLKLTLLLLLLYLNTFKYTI